MFIRLFSPILSEKLPLDSTFVRLSFRLGKKDAYDQHVYMERWQRLPEGGGPTFALRRRAAAFPSR